VVEEGFYDMAREVLRAFDAGETPWPFSSAGPLKGKALRGAEENRSSSFECCSIIRPSVFE
jgi:hypothetical protein